MLGKLLKYELKSTARYFIPLYIALIALTILNRFTLYLYTLDSLLLGILETFLMGAYVLTIIGTIVVTFVLIIVRFYKNLLTDEGYLTHTLPVKASCHINCKIISAFIWTILSVVMVVVSFLILFADSNTIPSAFKTIAEFFEEVSELGILPNIIFSIIIFILVMLISLFYNISMTYCSLSIGSLFNKHKILGAIGGYFIISYTVQIISTIATLLIARFLFWDFLDISYDISSSSEIVQVFSSLIGPFNSLMIISGVFSLIFSVIFYMLSNYILSKKLNLE